MLQELYRIHLPFSLPLLGNEIPIWSFGLMLVIGFLAALQLAKFLARRSGLDPEFFVNAGLIALIAGVVGARLSHVLENLPQYTDPTRSFATNFFDAINIRSGGLTYYGGFLLAFPILLFYALKQKLPLRLSMDIAAPCIMVGLGFGRIGCFLNGCCYGAVCDLPWAVHFPHHDAAVHPAQLYSAFTAFLIAGITWSYFTLPHIAGRAFALMLMLEGITRYVLEMLRVEPAVWGTGLSLSMWLGCGMVLLGLALWFAFGRVERAAAVAQPATLAGTS